MAISFVGSLVGSHRVAAAQTVLFSGLRDEAAAQPTLAENDVVYVAIEHATADVDRTQAELTPTGYTALHTDDYQNDSNDSNFLVSRKVMGATPDTSVDIPATNATSAGIAYTIYVLRGVDTATPEDVTPVLTGAINYGRPNAAAITPVTPGAWVLWFGGAAQAAGTAFTIPANASATTNHFRTTTITSATTDASIGGALYTGWTSGAFEPDEFGGGTTTTTGSWSAVTLAIRPAGGVTTHATTGALTGPSSAVAGSATRFRELATSGALTGPGSAVIGSSARFRAHPATGALTGQGSAIAGTAQHNVPHATTGALTGPGSAIAGSSARERLHGTSGALAGSGTVVSGTAARNTSHGTSGALAGPGSAIAGAAARKVIHAATGTLAGPGAGVIGAAIRTSTHATSGALVGADASLSGSANRTPRPRNFNATGRRAASSSSANRSAASARGSRTATSRR